MTTLYILLGVVLLLCAGGLVLGFLGFWDDVVESFQKDTPPSVTGTEYPPVPPPDERSYRPMRHYKPATLGTIRRHPPRTRLASAPRMVARQRPSDVSAPEFDFSQPITPAAVSPSWDPGPSQCAEIPSYDSGSYSSSFDSGGGGCDGGGGGGD